MNIFLLQHFARTFNFGQNNEQGLSFQMILPTENQKKVNKVRINNKALQDEMCPLTPTTESRFCPPPGWQAGNFRGTVN